MPRIINCTPESNIKAAINDAQPGGSAIKIASITVAIAPIAPMTLSANPVSVRRRPKRVFWRRWHELMELSA